MSRSAGTQRVYIFAALLAVGLAHPLIAYSWLIGPSIVAERSLQVMIVTI